MDNIGNYLYIVGYGGTTSTPTLPEGGAYNNNTDGTGIILKFATGANLGVQQWGTLIGGTGSDFTQLLGCTVDNSGNLWVTGTTNNSTYPYNATGCINSNPYNGNDDAIITGFNSANNMIYSSFYGGDGVDVGTAVTSDQSGNIYFTGYTTSPGNNNINLELANPGGNYFYQGVNGFPTGNNAFIAELIPTGFTCYSFLWSTYYGGNNNCQAFGITIDANENVYIAGSEQGGPGGGFLVPNSIPSWAYYEPNYYSNTIELSSYVAAFNPNDNYYWGTPIGFNKTWGFSICNSPYTNYLYIVGKCFGTTSNPQFLFLQNPANCWYQTNYLGIGNQSATITEFNINHNVITEINNVINNANGIEIYPNPSQGNFMLKWLDDKNEKVTISIYNDLGKCIYICSDDRNTELTIDFNDEPDGVYLCRIINEEGKIIGTSKFIVLK